MNKLEITIKGSSRTGKSTVALMIEKFLMEEGFFVKMDIENELVEYETEERFRNLIANNWDDRVDSIKEKTNIKIKQVQTIHNILKKD